MYSENVSASNFKLKVLLVDDEHDITTVMKSGLEAYGFDVSAFNSPIQALTEYNPNHYDVIILDVRMAELNGFNLAKAIWAKDANARICFLSAFEIYEKEAKMVFKDFKTHCFIKKPIAHSDLIKHIESHMITAT